MNEKKILESDSAELFYRWYVVPLKYLETLPNGDGGFVVLATSCFLYERYAKAKLKTDGLKGSTENVIMQLSNDYDTDKETAEAFWRVIRNGFLHQGMPLKNEGGNAVFPNWQTSHVYEIPINLKKEHNNAILQIQPWLFRDKVFDLYQSSPQYIEHNKSFPWAVIWEEK